MAARTADPETIETRPTAACDMPVFAAAPQTTPAAVNAAFRETDLWQIS
jgi:hypothetical protein